MLKLIVYNVKMLALLRNRLSYAKIATKFMKGQSEVKDCLRKLFQNSFKIMTLARTFRIFPTYFNEQKIQKLLEHQKCQEYLKYIKNDKVNSAIGSQQLKDIVKKDLELKTKRERKIIQCYIDYIRETENLVQSDHIMQILDIRNPQNWFPKEDSTKKRKFIYHYGSTNSGKTFNAINELKTLDQSKKGIYMAPLRLLAWQTQQKLGKCNLITGQEKDYQNSHLTSCTIQACSYQENYDVAIIDEIQMIGDQTRGWSWTQAVLGLSAETIHLCGDERALNLITKLIKITGDQIQFKKYNRLSKLIFLQADFNLHKIEPGDCLIDFSVRKLYKNRYQINELLGDNKTAIVYGKLPPQCRKQQAKLFNSQIFPYLTASNAIGMGLNLNIRKIIFTSLRRMNYDGDFKEIQDHEIRQIAGRAGRGYDHGFVQCTQKQIRKKVKKALKNVNVTFEEQKLESEREKKQESKDETQQYSQQLQRNFTKDECRIKKASLFFPYSVVERIKIKIETIMGRKIKLSEAIRFIELLSKQNKELFFIAYNQDFIDISDKLQPFNLQLHDQFIFCSLPFTQTVSQKGKNSIINFVSQFRDRGIVNIPSFISAAWKDNFNRYQDLNYLNFLQQMHMILDGYNWYCNHYQLYFPKSEKAKKIKEKICERISEILNNQGDLKKTQKINQRQPNGRNPSSRYKQ